MSKLRDSLEAVRETDTPTALLDWAQRRDELATRFEQLTGTPHERGETGAKGTAETIPLGLKPRYIHDRARLWVILGALVRHAEKADYDCTVPDWELLAPWTEELNDICKIEAALAKVSKPKGTS